MGGVFPQGYPVARIAEVRHDAVQPLAQFRATPLAHLAALHEVMLVWFQDTHPAAPTQLKNGADDAPAIRALQRQPAPALELLPLPVVAAPDPGAGRGLRARPRNDRRHAGLHLAASC